MMRLLTTAVVALMSTTAAFAADPVIMEPVPAMAPVPAVYDWTGFYVGLHGGYAFEDTADFNFIDAGTTSPTDFDGWFVGGTLGANLQWNWLVFGAEGDIAWADISGSDPCPNPAFSCEVDINWLASARGRLGVAWDRVLVYGTGGVAFADAEFDVPGPVAFPGFDETYIGWTAGGGVEVGIAQQWSVKGEYAFYDLGDETSAAGDLAASRANLDLDFHTVKLGVNYRF